MLKLGSQNSIILGLAVIVLGFIFKNQVTGAVGDNVYYLIMLVALLMSAYGVYIQMNTNSTDENLDEEGLRNKVILHTLARMTNADSNVMQVEVEAVKDTYKNITGSEITSKDIRVAALGALYEEKPFCTYLGKAEKRISVENKKKIMKALSTVMESDGVVNPLEVDFFNTVARCLKMEAGDLVDLK